VTWRERAHPNRWTNIINITGVLFVTERMSKGGTIKYLENAAMPFAQRFRQKFQERAVIEDMLSLKCQVADFVRYQYGAGGELLFMDIPYIGFVFDWEFRITS
jgi:hypothetical protein